MASPTLSEPAFWVACLFLLAGGVFTLLPSTLPFAALPFAWLLLAGLGTAASSPEELSSRQMTS
jgi:hypothetical protein